MIKLIVSFRGKSIEIAPPSSLMTTSDGTTTCSSTTTVLQVKEQVVSSVDSSLQLMPNDIKLIYENLRSKFGDMFEIDLAFVESIPRTARGKFPLLIQHLRTD